MMVRSEVKACSADSAVEGQAEPGTGRARDQPPASRLGTAPEAGGVPVPVPRSRRDPWGRRALAELGCVFRKMAFLWCVNKSVFRAKICLQTSDPMSFLSYLRPEGDLVSTRRRGVVRFGGLGGRAFLGRVTGKCSAASEDQRAPWPSAR